MRHALIVIDMQQGSFGEATPRHDTAGLIGRLNRLAAAVRAGDGAAIFVQHDGPPGDPHHPSQPGWRLLEALDVRPADTIVRKTACDSFLATTLEASLRALSIDRLIITGCATDYCVDTTVRSALARGYRTIVPSDGHHQRSAPPAGRQDHRAPQRRVVRFHRAGRSRPGAAVCRPAAGLIFLMNLPGACPLRSSPGAHHERSAVRACRKTSASFATAPLSSRAQRGTFTAASKVPR